MEADADPECGISTTVVLIAAEPPCVTAASPRRLSLRPNLRLMCSYSGGGPRSQVSVSFSFLIAVMEVVEL
jgi:hypothetical protein